MIFLGVEMFEVAGLKVICCSSDDDMTRYAVVLEVEMFEVAGLKVDMLQW